MGIRCPVRIVTLSLILFIGASGCGSEVGDGITGPPPGDVPVALQEVAAGLDLPLYLTAPPGDTERLFIVERRGSIRIVKAGTLLPTPFLDLTGLVSTDSERGFLGLAFDPQYAVNGRFVAHYNDLSGNTRISLFQVSSDPDIGDPATETVVFTAEQPFPNHKGGQILFGPDGLLYIGLGDGGGAGDPGGRGQNLAEPLGSVLRIDVSGGAPYVVPADNPFVGQADVMSEVWSYGLRNPWRFSFDRVTGDLYLSDVGQDAWEEVNVSPAGVGAGRGVNYGWSRMEGQHCFGNSTCDQTGLTLPAFEYSHDQGCSITGGYVYRGGAIPELQGHYFYSDFCQGWIRSFRYQDGQILDQAEWPTLRPGSTVVSFGEDAAGELYILAGARVVKIVPQ